MSRGQPINVTELPMEQLMSVANQIDNEVEVLGTSCSQLKVALNKYNAACCAVKELAKTKAGQSKMMVPLTTALYVPGTIKDTNKVLVDIGTGFYVEKSISDAVAFYERKAAFINKQLDLVQSELRKKSQICEDVKQVLKTRQMQQIRAMQSAKSS